MKPALILAAAALAAATPSAAARPRSGTPVGDCTLPLRLPRATPAGEVTLFGHIASLERTGARFVLRFDPALWLTGITARRAKLADTGSSKVLDDYYIRDSDHRLLTYLVPAGVPVTVLVRGSCLKHASVAALARSRSRAGFWIRVRLDIVRSIDQQFQP